MDPRLQCTVRRDELILEQRLVEEEVHALTPLQVRQSGGGARLLALAAREYEILEALSRPWRRAAA